MKSWSSAASTLVAALALGGGVFIAAHHPLDARVALLAFSAWVACAWRWPRAWLFVVPALLPAASLAPWTGWQMVDEFDLLLLGTLAAGHARLAQAGGGRWSLGALALLAVALVGLLRGWLDAGGGALDWFHSYPDAGNSPRVARSLVYAALCAPLLPAAWGEGAEGAARLRGGMLTGLALVVAVCLWERWAYPGLFDFAQIYRTTAMFWEMHVGGAAIDAYLAFAIPFVAWALHEAKSRAAWLGWALFALAVAYAALTTFSRGLYAATLLSLVVLGAAWWRREALHWIARLVAAVAAVLAYGALLAAVHEGAGALGVLLLLAASVGAAMTFGPAWGWRRYAALALAAGVLTEAVAVLGPGSFMRERWRSSDPDLTSRWAHWAAAAKSIDGPADLLLGIGLGRLPAHYAASGPAHEWSGTLRWQAGDPSSVRLGGPATRRRLGGGFALTQRVALPPGGPWRVTLTARALAPAEVRVELCERHLLYDGRCQGAWLQWSQAVDGWRTSTVTLGGPAFRDRFGRSGVLALSVVNAGGELQLAQVQLHAPDGRPMLSNARFEQGLAHWLPSAQQYFLPWHIDNLYLEWLIETGLLGLAVFAGLCLQAARGLVRAGATVAEVPYLAASLIAVLLVGAASSIIDAPRVAFLLLLSLLLACRLGRPRTG